MTDPHQVVLLGWDSVGLSFSVVDTSNLLRLKAPVNVLMWCVLRRLEDEAAQH